MRASTAIQRQMTVRRSWLSMCHQEMADDERITRADDLTAARLGTGDCAGYHRGTVGDCDRLAVTPLAIGVGAGSDNRRCGGGGIVALVRRIPRVVRRAAAAAAVVVDRADWTGRGGPGRGVA